MNTPFEKNCLKISPASSDCHLLLGHDAFSEKHEADKTGVSSEYRERLEKVLAGIKKQEHYEVKTT